MKSFLLQGPPGSGKTTMACRTALRTPVLAIDIDEKAMHMASLHDDIDSGALVVWTLGAALNEESLGGLVSRLTQNKKPSRQPQGWLRFASLIDRIPEDPIAQTCKTLVVDSFTLLGDHLKKLILYSDSQGASTLSPRNWGTYGDMWAATLTALRDLCRSTDKDLIVTVHERAAEVPGPGTKAVRSKNLQGIVTTEYVGTMDMKVAASIDGQFGIKIGAYFEEVYGLSVVIKEGGEPEWVCRVLPDGRRDLRTSYNVSGQAEFAPDFHLIAGVGSK